MEFIMLLNMVQKQEAALIRQPPCLVY